MQQLTRRVGSVVLVCLVCALSVSAVRVKDDILHMQQRRLAQDGPDSLVVTSPLPSPVFANLVSRRSPQPHLFSASPRDFVDDAKQAGLQAVGMVAFYGSGTTICTGALITPSSVLTAAHCFYDKPTKASKPYDKSVVKFYPAVSRDASGKLISQYGDPRTGPKGVNVTAIHVPEQYQALVTANPGVFGPEHVKWDFAVINLDRQLIDAKDCFGIATSCQVRQAENGSLFDLKSVATAGYPKGQDTGTLLNSSCTIPASFDKDCQDLTLFHQCSILTGNSGGPIWINVEEDDGLWKYIFSVQSGEDSIPGVCVSGSSGDRFADPTRCSNRGAEITDASLDLIYKWASEVTPAAEAPGAASASPAPGNSPAPDSLAPESSPVPGDSPAPADSPAPGDSPAPESSPAMGGTTAADGTGADGM